VNPHLAFLLGRGATGYLAPEHLFDLEQKSGLTRPTITDSFIRSIPPSMIDRIAGFRVPTAVTSAYVIPYPDPAGGWMSHVRMKIFPSITEGDGPSIKYLQPPRSGIRVFFPIATMAAVIGTDADLWCIEGEKKALAVAQQGLPTIGIAGISSWNAVGSRRLHPDFDRIPLMGRVVEIVPDSDWQTNPRVRASVSSLATALAAAGARPRVVVLPDEVSA
jgi:hypothetical protein